MLQIFSDRAKKATFLAAIDFMKIFGCHYGISNIGGNFIDQLFSQFQDVIEQDLAKRRQQNELLMHRAELARNGFALFLTARFLFKSISHFRRMICLNELISSLPTQTS
jgi:hypothetical protein